MMTNYVLNGDAHGDMAETALMVQSNPGLWRPYFDKTKQGKWKEFVDLRTGKMKVNKRGELRHELEKVSLDDLPGSLRRMTNNVTSLRKDQWIQLDRKVVMATRQRLRAWEDLVSSAPISGFDAYSKLTYEYEAQSDPGEAVVDMDVLSEGRHDEPTWKLRSIPLPITHSDFWFSDRRLSVSRNGGTPLDFIQGEAAGRRIGEMVERTTIGTETGVVYGPTSSGDARYDGTSQVRGYTNFDYRITKTDLTTPTGTNPEAVMTDVLEMVDLMETNGFFGPYFLYTSTGYSRYLRDDYFRSGSTSAVRLLRERILAIDSIQDIRRLDFLTSGYQMLLVQIDPEYMNGLNGMEVTVVQWDSRGGLRKNFIAMCIKVPLLRAPYNGVAPIVHATTS